MTTNRRVRSVRTAALLVVLTSAAWETSAQANWDYCMNANEGYAPTKIVDGTLHVSSAKGATEIVEKLLNAGANPNVANSYGYAPLHVAALAGQTAIAEALLNAGADPDVRAVEASHSGRVLQYCAGFTALHYAGRAGHVDIVDALLAAGADANAAAKDGTTPIYWADKAGHVDAVVSLLTAGATHE